MPFVVIGLDGAQAGSESGAVVREMPRWQRIGAEQLNFLYERRRATRRDLEHIPVLFAEFHSRARTV